MTQVRIRSWHGRCFNIVRKSQVKGSSYPLYIGCTLYNNYNAGDLEKDDSVVEEGDSKKGSDCNGMLYILL